MTSKARVERDTRKMAVKSIVGIVTFCGIIHLKAWSPNLPKHAPSLERTAPRLSVAFGSRSRF
jgi:hypothetical protein